LPIVDPNDDQIIKRFSRHYQDELFLLWYAEGKPTSSRFHHIIPPDVSGEKPTLSTIKRWMNYGKWRKRAETIDEEVKQQIEAHAIAEKVEMLTRHAKVGKQLQEDGAEYLKDHLDELTPSTAVRMIIEGVRIEQNSRGIGTAFKEMVEMSDEDLTTKIEDLIGKSKVEILQIDDGNDYDEED